MTSLTVVSPNPYLDPSFIDALSDRQVQEYSPATMLKWNRYIPHAPSPRQLAFLVLPHDEAMYGGAAGGGKSDALLMAATQYVDVPEYSALLLRRTYADLEKPGALIPRSHQWFGGTDAKWRGDKKQWWFPNGAVISFGYLDNDRDMYKFQSSEYQFAGFDELTQFQENWYRYIMSRTRRLMTMTQVPVRVRSATNPGGEGHDWVKRRFIDEGIAAGRPFIRAKLDDNPHLDRDEYRRALAKLDPVTRAQLEDGDWDVRPAGAFFNPVWFNVIDDYELPPNLRWIRSWDMAATKSKTSAYTAGVKMAAHEGKVYITHVARQRGDPGETEQLIKHTAEMDGKQVNIWIEQEGGSSGVNTIWRYQRTVLFGYAVRAYHPRMDKVLRARPLSATARYGGVYLVRQQSGDNTWMTPYIDECAAFPNGFKDQVDSSSQGFDALTSQLTEPRARSL